MKVFVTGGTGTVGTPIVAELINHGHSVLGLARSDKSALALKEAGAEVLRGELADLDVLQNGAQQSDGVISLAFTPNYGTEEGLISAVKEESAATAALAEALVGTDKPIVVSSGTPWISGRMSTEADDLIVVQGPLSGRAHAQEALLALSSRGVRSVTVRLPRTVHNNGQGGFAGILVDSARRSGAVGYPGDGSQRWPSVHALDAAVLFRLVLESAAAGTSWHAVADEGIEVKDIAAVIGRRLNLPINSVPEESFGPFGPIFAMDQPSSSAHTRKTFGWQPTHPNLLDDLENIRP